MEISKAEYDVMCAVWEAHPCSANDVIARLQETQDWHEKTVKTLLGRLVKKGALATQADKRRYLYSPLIAKQDYQQKESLTFVERMFKGKLSPLVAGFAQQGKLNQEDVDALKNIITDWEKNND